MVIEIPFEIMGSNVWKDTKTGMHFRVVHNRDQTERYIQHAEEYKGTQDYYWNDTKWLYEYQSEIIEYLYGSWTIDVYIKNNNEVK